MGKTRLALAAAGAVLVAVLAVVTGLWPEPDLAALETWLRSVGGLLVRAAMESAGLEMPEDMQRHMGEFVVPWRHPGCATTEDNDDQ